mmetsp:Transcript_3365/g.10450  ORF Transcript_3365/g.10450 Transcript_3365/m.10450 type:complete len:303 (+) Transcript_3365:111-1019(+)
MSNSACTSALLMTQLRTSIDGPAKAPSSSSSSPWSLKGLGLLPASVMGDVGLDGSSSASASVRKASMTSSYGAPAGFGPGGLTCVSGLRRELLRRMLLGRLPRRWRTLPLWTAEALRLATSKSSCSNAPMRCTGCVICSILVSESLSSYAQKCSCAHAAKRSRRVSRTCRYSISMTACSSVESSVKSRYLVPPRKTCPVMCPFRVPMKNLRPVWSRHAAVISLAAMCAYVSMTAPVLASQILTVRLWAVRKHPIAGLKSATVTGKSSLEARSTGWSLARWYVARLPVSSRTFDVVLYVAENG